MGSNIQTLSDKFLAISRHSLYKQKAVVVLPRTLRTYTKNYLTGTQSKLS